MAMLARAAEGACRYWLGACRPRGLDETFQPFTCVPGIELVVVQPDRFVFSIVKHKMSEERCCSLDGFEQIRVQH